MHTGASVRDVRKAVGLTQAELCAHLGVSISALRRWEQNPEMAINSTHYKKIEELSKQVRGTQFNENQEQVGPNAEGLVAKIITGAGTITRELVLDAMTLFYATADQKTSVYSKSVAIAALAYFIMPLDAIPDFLPIVGYSDDAAMLVGAVITLKSEITEKHRRRALERLDELL